MAQETIKGLVIDETSGETLIGANVQVEGTTDGTVTDFDGAFELRTRAAFPLVLLVSYVGYDEKKFTIAKPANNLKLALSFSSTTLVTTEIRGQRISEKQKAAPLTIESIDVLAIRQTPTDNFYDGLGALKGVDLTAASLGFKIVNTRGFNSTSPVRSLQIIDGVDNQAPGLNFSLGNFLGSSELDVMKVDLIVGASSAFYGPNAFNGVISMESKNPFSFSGLSAMVKGGERNLLETAIRFADVVSNRHKLPVYGYKLNFSYLRANDWEADNYDPVYNTRTDRDNPGRFDAVNIYGDEYSRFFDLSGSNTAPWNFIGLKQWHRTGYREVDLVDYNTRNIKANAAFHLRLKPEQLEESPELILASSFGSGTTVYQGENRFSLRGILFFQNRLELRKTGKYFLRAYATHDDAGRSYDPYFTALRLQQRSMSNQDWSTFYVNYWRNNIEPRIKEQGYPQLEFLRDENGNIVFGENGVPIITFDYEGAEQWLADNRDSLFYWHSLAENVANAGGGSKPPALQPGTPEFEAAFNEITSAKSNSEENGTRFFDKSALYHVQGEYRFTPTFIEEIVVGGNGRLYTPISDGTIFSDTAGIRITNAEIGMYLGLQEKFYNDRLIANATLRIDKNQNFRWLASPAASLVYKPRANNYLRFSFSSAIRNPTLSDQYLFLNVGPAILTGNLVGVDSVITVPSFLDFIDSQTLDTLEYFSLNGVRPEQVRTLEAGYRTTLFNRLYVDASYYYSFYQHFLGFRLGIDSDFNDLGFPINTQVYRYAANSDNVVTTQGFSIGMNYYFRTYYAINGNYSWNRLNKQLEDDPIIPAFNTPEHKFNIGISGRDIQFRVGGLRIKDVGFNVNYKWIQGFLFEGSPQFTGLIPSYDLLDGQVNYRVRKWDTTFKLGASNILNNKVFQAYGGPRIGRMAYFSIVYDFRKL